MVTPALVTARRVGASPVAAEPWVARTLVIIDAAQAGVVEDMSRGAFAAERTVRVDATSASANVRPDRALVQILQVTDAHHFIYKSRVVAR